MLDDELIKKVRAEYARQGGLARAKSLTAKERLESSRKAAKASAAARKRKAAAAARRKAKARKKKSDQK
jgi:hypothetical protein